jgi:hypothetical protein
MPHHLHFKDTALYGMVYDVKLKNILSAPKKKYCKICIKQIFLWGTKLQKQLLKLA